MQPNHQRHELASGAVGSREPDWLACSAVPVAGARTNDLDRRVVAVVNYLQGGRARWIDAASIAKRWPSWLPAPCTKSLQVALRRLAARGVLQHRDGGFRVDRGAMQDASDRGCRFRFEPADFIGTAPATAALIGLVRGRSHGRVVAWGDSAGFLADLVGCDERTVRAAIDEAQAAGRLEVVAHSRLRTGHRLPVLRVVGNGGKPTPPRHLRVERSPGREERSPGCSERTPDNLRLQSADLAPLGTSPATPSPVLLLTWTPTRPASPEQSRAGGADDPRASRPQAAARQTPPPPPAVRVVPTWAAIEAAERDAVAALAAWEPWLAHLQRTVAQLHLAHRDVHAMHLALITAGVLLPWRPMTAAGRAGLRRRRVAMAEELAAHGAEPSLVLEWSFARSQRLRAEGAEPRAIGPDLAAAIAPKGDAYVQRSNDRVAAGGAPPPMAAGVDALHRLVQPQRRDAGRFAYPAAWWRGSVVQAVRDRLDDVRQLLATVTAAAHVREVAGEVAAAKLRHQLAAAERERREQRQQQQIVDAARAHRSRMQGAVAAGDWRRLKGYMQRTGATPADVARMVSVPVDTIAAGLAQVRASA